MPDPSGCILDIKIPRGHHSIVNAIFQGSATKTLELTEMSGRLVSFHRNCGGEMSPTTVLIGDENHRSEYRLTLNGYSYECGQHGERTNNLKQISGPVGGFRDEVSVETYVFARDGFITTLDTVSITIIIQVGIDPSTSNL